MTTGSNPSYAADSAFRFAGPYATSQRVIWGVLLVLALNILRFFPVTSVAQVIANVGALLASSMVTWAYFTGVGRLIAATAPRPGVTRVGLLLALFATAEMLRTCLNWFVAAGLGVESDPAWALRLSAGATTGLIVFWVAATVVNDAARYRASYVELYEQRVKLDSALDESRRAVDRSEGELATSIRTRLQSAISTSLNSQDISVTALHELAEKLFDAVESIVRPASRRLMTSVVEMPAPPLALTPPRVRLKAVVVDTTLARPIRTLRYSLIILGLAAPVVIFGAERYTGLVLATMLAISLVLFVGERWIQPLVLKRGIIWRIVIPTLFLAIPGGAISSAVAFQVTGEPAVIIAGFIFGSIFGFLMGWSLALIDGLAIARGATLADIAEVNEELSWATKRTQARVWVTQQSLAMTLHNEVQGNLLAAGMRIHSIISSELPVAEREAALSELASGIARTMELDLVEHEPLSVSESARQITENWSGLVDIHFELAEAAEQRIDADPLARRVLGELCREFVTNAVKHGSATQLAFTIEMTKPSLISLCCRNNGQAASPTRSSGVGSSFVDRVTLNLQVSSGPEFQMCCDIPISVDDSLGNNRG